MGSPAVRSRRALMHVRLRWSGVRWRGAVTIYLNLHKVLGKEVYLAAHIGQIRNAESVPEVLIRPAQTCKLRQTVYSPSGCLTDGDLSPGILSFFSAWPTYELATSQAESSNKERKCLVNSEL